jgi:hypothetical protein
LPDFALEHIAEKWIADNTGCISTRSGPDIRAGSWSE